MCEFMGKIYELQDPKIAALNFKFELQGRILEQ